MQVVLGPSGCTTSRTPSLPVHTVIMPTPDRAASPKARDARESEEDRDEAATAQLCELAEAVARDAARGVASSLSREQAQEFHRLIKRSLHQKKDEILYDALARMEHADHDAGLALKLAIEEAAEITVIERPEGKKREINAFVIPVFLHSLGGLDPERCFQDQEAFDLLTHSLQDGELESAAARVVLVNHGYHLNEIDGITFSHLHEMLRDAFAAMTDKRIAATPAIDRSFGGWPDNPFALEDQAIELRFLLGFALKDLDDPFYAVPEDDAAADAYFTRREQRFQKWTATAAPLVRRCFGLPPEANGQRNADGDVHFLYQDLFHGGKERGIAEYFMLQMMSTLNHDLQQQGIAPEATRALIGPADLGEETVLRVHLHALDDGRPVASADKPVPGLPDWSLEVAEAHGALTMIGVKTISVAQRFAHDGTPIDVMAYHGENQVDAA